MTDAVRAITITPVPGPGYRTAYTVTWATLDSDDSGTPMTMAAWGDRSVQITGTFGSGGTVVIEGSNDGTNYKTLTDPQGNALSFTASAIEQIEEATAYLRPRVTAGDGTTALVVTLLITGHTG